MSKRISLTKLFERLGFKASYGDPTRLHPVKHQPIFISCEVTLPYSDLGFLKAQSLPNFGTKQWHLQEVDEDKKQLVLSYIPEC